MRQRWSESGLIALTVLAAYSPALFCAAPPIDQGFLAANPLLRLPWAEFWSGLWSRRYFLLTGEATYQPLVTMMHYLTWRAPLVFHWIAIGAHALNAGLVCVLAKRLGMSAKAGVLAGLLLAAFPPATEPVAVASFAGHVFGLAFTLACVICGLSALEGGRRSRRWLGGSAAAFILGCLCKETIVVAPALLALCWLCDSRPAPWRRAAGLAACLPTLAALFLVWRFAVLPSPRGMPAPHRADWMLSLGWYARMLLWPWPLCFEHASLAPGLTAFAGLFALVGAATALRPALFLGWAWILLELMPYLHIAPFAHTSPVADRYLYSAAAGLCLLLARALDFRGGRAALAALAAGWACFCVSRNALLADEPALCEQTAACSPDSLPAQVMLGNSQLARGLYSTALRTFERAVSVDASSPVPWSGLGIAQYMLDDYDASIASFRKAIAVGDAPALHNNLGNALAARGLYAQAAAEYDAAARLLPGWEDPIANAKTARRLMREGPPTSARAPKRPRATILP